VSASVWADVLRTVLVVVHVGVTAAWLGAMVYSIAVVQPKLAEFFVDPAEREDFATVLASGARWKVLTLAALLTLSGAGLTWIELTEADSPSSAWTALVAAKSACLRPRSRSSPTCRGACGRPASTRTCQVRGSFAGSRPVFAQSQWC
jgi:hypothetical protein